MKKSISLNNDKYRFVISDSHQVLILRYGEDWREFDVGDKAMFELVEHTLELEKENSMLKAENQAISAAIKAIHGIAKIVGGDK
jgi:hypothetical protein